MRPRAVVATAVACVAVLVTAVAIVSYQAGRAGVPVLPSSTPSASADVGADLDVLAELYRQLSEDAVDPPESEELLQGAIEGMLEVLDDPYALYFDADAFRQFSQQLDGTFSGVGLMLEDTPDGPVVVSVLPGTPAEAAGVELPNADGKSLLPLLAGEPGEWRRAVLIEHLRGTNPVPTYCAIRTARYLFASYETGERELFDLDADPFQLRNLAGTAPDLEGRLETTLRGLCDPPPPGFGGQMSMAATLLGIAAVLAVAAGARVLLARSGERRGVA
jgi:hypothetical protein